MQLSRNNTTVSLLSAISNAGTKAPHSDTVMCQSGRVQYLARGSLVQIQNAATQNFPDFSMALQHWSLFWSWLKVEGVTAAELSFSSTSLTVTREGSVLTLPLNTRIPLEYASIDEVALMPLLTNKYMLEVAQHAWFDLDVFELIHSPRDKRTPTLSVDVVDGNLRVSSSNGGISLTKIIPILNQPAVPNWSGLFALDSLTLRFISTAEFSEPNKPEVPIKLSFTDNTRLQLSPLLVEYENGVSVVASPLYA